MSGLRQVSRVTSSPDSFQSDGCGGGGREVLVSCDTEWREGEKEEAQKRKSFDKANSVTLSN